MVDPNSRLAREQETRETAQRTREWVPPQSLPSPAPKEGVVYRWIRTGFMGQNDHTNVAAKIREGWEPCKAVDYPEIQMSVEGFGSRPASGNIEIGGLVLCRASASEMEKRKRYYANQTAAQVEAVDNSFMQTEDKRMPLFRERKSDTSRGFGRGNK